jgi:hypothetical protein
MWVLYDPVKEEQSDKLTTEETQFAILRLKTKLINQYLIWRDDWTKWKKLNAFLDSNDSPFMNIPTAAEKEVAGAPQSKSQGLKMSPAKPETIQKIKSSMEFSDVQAKEITMQDVLKGSTQQFDGDEFWQAQHDQTNSTEATRNTAHIDFKNLSKATAPGQRKLDDQYKIELLLIHQKGQMFRTAAKDISLTGTSTEKVIPAEFHECTFDLVVINNMINDDDHKRIKLKATTMVTDSRLYLKFDNLTDVQKNSLRASLDYYIRMLKKLKEQA